MKAFVLLVVLIVGLMKFSGCDSSGNPEIHPEEFHPVLSEYNFFRGRMADIQPAEGTMPFELTNALYSDGAIKSRFIRLPDDGRITFHENEPFGFPEGTFLIKNFAFRVENGEIFNIETRLMLYSEGTWRVANYLWNSEQTEAYFDLSGRLIPIDHLNEDEQLVSFTYEIPDKAECTTCHSRNGKVMPIGLKARHLNKEVRTPGGRQNQLGYWQQNGWISTIPSHVASLPDIRDSSVPVSERALAYLDINCGHCHSKSGTARSSRLFMDLDDYEPFGVCKIPVAGGVGGPRRPYVITPGSADSSLLVFRMESLDPQVKMPEVGRGTIDKTGLSLIRDWINAMDPVRCGE